jgi:hypothetical protein
VTGRLQLDTAQAWQGTLVTDGFNGYTACFDKGVTSAQCMAHARRKFNDLWANHRSEVGRKALRYYQCLFRIEREIGELPSDDRRRIRQRKSRRVLSVFHRWLLAQRHLVPTGSATMKAIDYSAQALEATHPLRRGRRRADLQQLGGKPHQANCDRPQQLALHRQSARWEARRGDHESGAFGPVQRA